MKKINVKIIAQSIKDFYTRQKSEILSISSNDSEVIFLKSKIDDLFLGKQKELLDIVKVLNTSTNIFFVKNISDKYDDFRKEYAYDFINSLDITVCPYCGRSFIYGIDKSINGTTLNKVQAEFDHFYPKSKYSYLSLSFYNLIPVCGNCNLMKSSQINPILYPYEDSFDDYYKFIYQQGIIKLKQIKYYKNAEVTKKTFLIEEFYQKHLDIAKSLELRKKIYSEQFITEINNILIDSKKKITYEDIKKIILGQYYNDKKQKLILSKFIRDIAKDLGLL